MKYRSAAITDIGKIRQDNEDRFICDEALGLFGVADGIGGIPGGGDAAECTVQEIANTIHSPPTCAELVAITRDISQKVRNLGQLINPPIGIGTTLTYGVFHEGKLRLAHVGDSRAYLINKGTITPLTRDHTIGNEIHSLRARGEDIVLSSANRNSLSRCIGQPELLDVDVSEIPVTKGDRYFFTTDGICRMINDQELGDILNGHEDPANMLRYIMDLALKRGGFDNLTAVLIYIDEV